jgi:aminoglycoside 2'-N-acetyltransferase I
MADSPVWHPGLVTEIHVMRTADLAAERLNEISDLVWRTFVDDFSEDDWLHCLGGWHITAHVGATLVAHAAVIERTMVIGSNEFQNAHCVGYVEAVATAPERQRQGLGRVVMERVNMLIADQYEMGALATGAHGFYERLGWERWRGPSFVRTNSATLRTEEEDDGIMILRCAQTTNIDVASAICCEQRVGDDW